MSEAFEAMLTGGHPNSLGRTEEVTGATLADPSRLTELFDTYHSADAVVRLRTSSALKRLAKADSHFLLPLLDRLLTETAELDQASAQWTLAEIFVILRPHMSPAQFSRALSILKRNLEGHSDWIVLCQTMKALGGWATTDPKLSHWLKPQLERHANDPRKSVAKTASKTLNQL